MHEASLAREILKAVLERATMEGARRVVAVNGWLAESEAVSLESLEYHFAVYAVGTPAQGAVLRLRTIRVPVRCGACGKEYLRECHVTVCPDCGSVDGVLSGITGIGIESMEVDESGDTCGAAAGD